MQPGKAVVIAVAAVVLACDRPSPELTHTQNSAEALARSVLEALAANSEARLTALQLSEAEFKAHVWPALPASRPERNLPFSYVWGDLRQKSNAALRRTMTQHGGHRYQFQRVDFEGGTTNYGHFRVHRKARFVVREPAGQPLEMRLCGSFFEMAGQWKVFSFVVDD